LEVIQVFNVHEKCSLHKILMLVAQLIVAGKQAPTD